MKRWLAGLPAAGFGMGAWAQEAAPPASCAQHGRELVN